MGSIFNQMQEVVDNLTSVIPDYCLQSRSLVDIGRQTDRGCIQMLDLDVKVNSVYSLYTDFDHELR